MRQSRAAQEPHTRTHTHTHGRSENAKPTARTTQTTGNDERDKKRNNMEGICFEPQKMDPDLNPTTSKPIHIYLHVVPSLAT